MSSPAKKSKKSSAATSSTYSAPDGTTVSVDTDAGFLTVVVPLKPGFPQSSSGKSRIVASTHGNLATECAIPGLGNVVVGLNAYVKN